MGGNAAPSSAVRLLPWPHCQTHDLPLISLAQSVVWVVPRKGNFPWLAWLLQPLTPLASVITADLHPGPFCRKSLYPVCHSLVWLVRLYLDNRKWPPLTGRIEMRFHTQMHLTFSQ